MTISLYNDMIKNYKAECVSLLLPYNREYERQLLLMAIGSAILLSIIFPITIVLMIINKIRK